MRGDQGSEVKYGKLLNKTGLLNKSGLLNKTAPETSPSLEKGNRVFLILFTEDHISRAGEGQWRFGGQLTGGW